MPVMTDHDDCRAQLALSTQAVGGSLMLLEGLWPLQHGLMDLYRADLSHLSLS
jgi:hypothetical protein